jgi:hypothetical protein
MTNLTANDKGFLSFNKAEKLLMKCPERQEGVSMSLVSGLHERLLILR